MTLQFFPTKGAEYISQCFDLVFGHMTRLGQENGVQVSVQVLNPGFKRPCVFSLALLRFSHFPEKKRLWKALWSEKGDKRHGAEPP